jgi:hypothetical protein
MLIIEITLDCAITCKRHSLCRAYRRLWDLLQRPSRIKMPQTQSHSEQKLESRVDILLADETLGESDCGVLLNEATAIYIGACVQHIGNSLFCSRCVVVGREHVGVCVACSKISAV